MIEVEVFETPELIAKAAAERLSDHILAGTQIKLVALTGGTLGIEVIREFGRIAKPDLPVRFVFGDERFVALDHADRNEYQGIHAWPGLANYLLRYPDAQVGLDSARDAFASELMETFGSDPVFDLTILGMGPDGHVASLFPGHEQPGSVVVSEPKSPKPPAERLSLSYQALNNSREVWFVASGAAKATAVRCALSEDCDLPVAKVKGLEKTHWFIDSELKREL